MFWGFFKVKMNCGGLLSLTEQFQGGTGDAKGCTMSLPLHPRADTSSSRRYHSPGFTGDGAQTFSCFWQQRSCFPSHLGCCSPGAMCAHCHERFMVSEGWYQSHCVELHPSCSQGLPQHPSEHVCWEEIILFCSISVQAAENCSNK